MKEWDYEKNKNLDPKTITNGSNKKAWWKCNKEHKYISKIAHRVNGSGCPYCSNTKVLKGYNDLKTKYPKIAKEWNYEKNKGLTPEMVMSNSHKKVWWKCNKGHEWEATIASRNEGNGCPYCSNKKVLKSYNDLATTEPKLAKEWNYEKNKGLTPEMVTFGSSKKVWWICEKGHEWEATIGSRSSNHGCQYCSNKKVLKGYNDLATINPKLAKEWNYEKNQFSPSDILPFSNKKVWWKCNKCGYEWQYKICHRSNGYGKCPYCSGKYSVKGETDLKKQ